jgi:hypothetical protein
MLWRHTVLLSCTQDESLTYALLERRGRPVSGAVIELFGPDLAHLKYAVTDSRLRKRGHYTRLHRCGSCSSCIVSFSCDL